MITYNFEPLKARKIIEPGIYSASIKKVESRVTSKGDPQRMVVFELENGDTIADFILETKQVEWKIQQLFYACEMKCEGKVKVSDEWSEVLGKELQVKIETQEYNGKENSRIVAYYLPKQNPEEPENA